MQIGDRIKKLRVEHNFSQKYMADVLNISQGYYNKIENGQANINADKLQSIADIFNIAPGELFSANDNYFTNTFEVNKGQIGSGNILYQAYSEQELDLFKDQIRQLKKENAFLKSIIDRFQIQG